MLKKVEIVSKSQKAWGGSDSMSTQLDLLAKSQVNLDILGVYIEIEGKIYNEIEDRCNSLVYEKIFFEFSRLYLV